MHFNTTKIAKLKFIYTSLWSNFHLWLFPIDQNYKTHLLPLTHLPIKNWPTQNEKTPVKWPMWAPAALIPLPFRFLPFPQMKWLFPFGQAFPPSFLFIILEIGQAKKPLAPSSFKNIFI